MNRQDFFRLARQRLRITPGAQLDPASVDKTGSTVNIFAAMASALAEECDAQSQARFAAQLTSSARDGDLDRAILERSHGEVVRLGAAAATLDVYVSRPTDDAGAGVVEAGTEVLAGGMTWTLDSSVVFAAGQLGPFQASLTCAQLGSAGNGVPPGVQAFKSPGALFDPSLVVESFLAPSAGGAERESDSAYAARYAQWDAGLDRNLDFLAAGALGVPGVAQATAVEDLDLDGNPVGTATVYVADVNGRATDALLARVRAALRGFRLAGQHVVIARTLPDYRSLVLTFGVLDTYSTVAVKEQARAAVVAAVNALKPGAPLLRATIATALKAVPGVVLLSSAPFGLVVGSPGDADVYPATPSTLYRTKPELVTIA